MYAMYRRGWLDGQLEENVYFKELPNMIWGLASANFAEQLCMLVTHRKVLILQELKAIWGIIPCFFRGPSLLSLKVLN